jgi:hypothetical protein
VSLSEHDGSGANISGNVSDKVSGSISCDVSITIFGLFLLYP